MTEQFGEYAEEYIERMLRDAQQMMDALSGQDVILKDLVDIAKIANSWIMLAAGENYEAYEEYKYHVAEVNGKFIVYQGEIDTDPEIEDL